MRRGAWWLLVATLALGAFFFRLPKLTERPMHADEAIHAFKLGILMDTGMYEYNPNEYHGPVIYYAAWPFVRMAGAREYADIPDETPLRLPIVIFGAMLVLATALCGSGRDGLGRREAFFAAALLAVSPAFTFYSRYYIQEIPFTLFCFLALVFAWKLLRTQHVGWAALMGLALGITIALKETWILVIGAAGLSAGLLHLTSADRPWPKSIPCRKYLGVFSVGAVVTLFTGLYLLSDFFRNPPALVGAFTSMIDYIGRGVSGDSSSTFVAHKHVHPWYYYLQLLTWPKVAGPWIWTEGGTLLLGCVGIAAVVRSWKTARGQWHFIVIFTVLLTAFYSGIPYKTPWNVLPMLLGWSLLAGRGFAAAMDLAGSRRIVAIAIGALLMLWPAMLAVQSFRANIKRPADMRNPYAYSATSPSIYRLVKRAEQVAKVSPLDRDMIIQIISPIDDYWPIPWYLRRFPNIGYYRDPAKVDANAAMIIISPAPDPETLLDFGSRQSEFYGLRTNVLVTALTRQDLWDEFMKGQTKMKK